MQLFPLCLTFNEFVVSICKRLNFSFIINTMSLSLTKFGFTLTTKQQPCHSISISRFQLRSHLESDTPQYLLSLLSKIIPNTCSEGIKSSFHSPSHSKVLLSTNTGLPHLLKVIQLLNPTIYGKMQQVAFSFQIYIKVKYVRNSFNFKCELQIFI